MIADLSIMADSLTTPLDDSFEKLDRHVSIEQQPESHCGTMKLVVRSPYWGRILKGKTRRNYDNGSMAGVPYRVISCQVVLSTVEGQYWGCCPHHGKRVLELKEHHFTDHYTGDWDLYMVGSSVASNYVVHSFFLLPREQNLIDVNYKVAMQGWVFKGAASASLIRMDLEGYLSDILKQNTGIGYHFHHVHMEILMNEVLDRETPRSRRVTPDKSCFGDNSVATLQSPHSTDDAISTSNVAPPVPRVVSNDTSWLSDAASSNSASSTTVVTSAAMAPPSRTVHHHFHHPVAPVSQNWVPDSHGTQFHPATYHPTVTPGQEYVQWFPASMAPLGSSPPPILPSMTPTHPMFHQGYGGHTAAPSAYFHPVSIHHSQQMYSAPSSEYFYYGGAPHSHSSMHDYGDDGEQALNEHADEKYNEDVATASVSETTQEEDYETERYQHVPSPCTASEHS